MKKNKKQAIAYIHTHFDPEWYRTVDCFNVRLVEIFDLALLELQKGNLPHFYFDGQVYALLNYLKFRPEKKALIKRLIKEKKLSIGPFFASCDNFLVSGASLIKNLELGLKISKEFGENDFIGYLSDTFGHSKGIFEILKLFKIDSAIIWRGVPKNLPSDFIANKIKTTCLKYGYYQDILHTDIKFEEKISVLNKILNKINQTSGNVLLLPLGADHMAPLINAKQTINEVNKHLDNYEIVLKSPFEYVKKAKYEEKYEGEFLDNSETFILQGVYSSRIDEKAENARLQWDLFNKAVIFNRFSKEKYEKELEFATLELIKNHAHDSIYGCSLDSVHKTVRARQLSVRETTSAVMKNLIRDFKKENLVSENKDYIGVFNFSNYPQNGTLKIITDKKIKNGQKIRQFKSVSDDIMTDIFKNPMTEDFRTFFEYLIEIDDIKPFSFKNFEIKKPVKCHTVGIDFIENKNLKLFVLENEILALNKKNGKLYNDFIQLHSTKDDGDSYNFAPAEKPRILKLKNTKIKQKGKIKSTLQLIFEENIKINVSLTNFSEFFELEADFNNKKKNRKLQIAINTNSILKETEAEDSIKTIKRTHNPNYLLFSNMPAPEKKELQTNAYPMQRFVKANGIGIITEGLNEYEIYKNFVKIALLRSTSIISNPKNQARAVPAGPPIECPDMQGIGQHNLRLAITFDDDLFKLADNFYDPYLGILGEFKIKNKTILKNEKDKVFYGFIKENGRKAPIFL